MKLVQVESMPIEKRKDSKNIKGILEEFVRMNVDFIKFEFDESEYKSAKVAYTSLWNSAKRYGIPVKVRFIRNEIYLVRRD